MRLRHDRRGGVIFETTLRVDEAEAVEHMRRQRGWTKADLVRSTIALDTGHQEVNPAVSALSFQVPEPHIVNAVASLNDAITQARSTASRLAPTLPDLATKFKQVAADMEESLRWFSGAMRDYNRLRQTKGLPPVWDFSASRHDVDA